ncbi:MAG: CDP-alcohol phosphatidyltransferase family protein [Eggerthellaceae bacterium]|nr:CDP-alcohol phosphatidyltransferase family protein [Eggerthellaceae bacterium]
MKMKYVPNVVTCLRIVLCIVLIFLKPAMGTASFIVFVVAGITDMVDGPLARRIPNAQSLLGQDLDAFADMLLIVVGVFVLLPAMDTWSWLFPAVIGILVYKLVSASLSGLIKHKKVLFTHTLANKISAMFLFLGPILYFVTSGHAVINYYLIFLIIWVFLATTEEALINFFLTVPNKNVRGIWKVKEENEKAAQEAAAE